MNERIIVEVGSGGIQVNVEGQNEMSVVLESGDDVMVIVESGERGAGLPAGGTDNQMVLKSGSDPYDFKFGPKISVSSTPPSSPSPGDLWVQI